MNYDNILARLNLYAVLPNLEELVKNDSRAAELARSRDICVQFIVRGGPRAHIRFCQGTCQFGQGPPQKTDVSLFFTSCGHLNRMFDGQANPVPLKGFSKIGFLTHEFKQITERLEYFLDSAQGDLQDASYRELNTLLTLHTAARAVTVLLEADPAARSLGAGLPDGSLMMKVLPEGPAVALTFSDGSGVMEKGEAQSPLACMYIKDIPTASDLLNQKLDPFAAIALGDVKIRGLIPMIDTLDLILDRVPYYLTP